MAQADFGVIYTSLLSLSPAQLVSSACSGDRAAAAWRRRRICCSPTATALLLSLAMAVACRILWPLALAASGERPSEIESERRSFKSFCSKYQSNESCLEKLLLLATEPSKFFRYGQLSETVLAQCLTQDTSDTLRVIIFDCSVRNWISVK